jgi:acetyl esterase/lipase
MKSIHVAIVGAMLTLALSAELANAQPAGRPLPKGVQAHRDIEYVADGHERNKLDLYLPEKGDGPLPLVVWVHGGAWWAGSKENCPALPLVERGYAVASINYRLSQHAVFPAQIEDCKAAVRWLRANAEKHGIDADRVGVWGASAGGHLVALLGTAGDVKEFDGKGDSAEVSSRVQCVVDWFGPANFLTMRGRHDNADSPEAKLIGGAIQDNKEKAARANPITYVDKNDPPFLIMHGEDDRVVPINQSEELDQALRAAGVDVTLVRIPDAGHGGPGFNTPAIRKQIDDFFAKHLKKPK